MRRAHRRLGYAGSGLGFLVPWCLGGDSCLFPQTPGGRAWKTLLFVPSNAGRGRPPAWLSSHQLGRAVALISNFCIPQAPDLIRGRRRAVALERFSISLRVSPLPPCGGGQGWGVPPAGGIKSTLAIASGILPDTFVDRVPPTASCRRRWPSTVTPIRFSSTARW